MAKRRDPDSPGQATIKRLFAHSGNRCAFPRCTAALVLGDTIVGEICHIKSASANGPRYDPKQTAAARHGYQNLILLCATHHKVVDDDPDAYTVARLAKMKRDHEKGRSLPEEHVNRGAQLLLSVNQSGGIAAQTIHTINVHALAAEPDRARQPEPHPDMSIRDLFFHIRPDLLDDHQAKDWQSVGRDVMDKFSTDQLKVWGRLISADRSNRGPLVLIDPAYWSKVEFSYWFLEKNHERADHTWPNPRQYGGPIVSRVLSYCDLQVNRTQAESIWPPFIPITEASRACYEATEGAAYGDLNSRLDKTADERLRRHIDAFLVRKFELWGKSPPSTTRRRIPETDVGALRWIEGTNSLGSQFASQPGRYDDVTMTRADLMKYIAFLKRMEEIKL